MKKQISNRQDAEELAIAALIYIANDKDLMPRFLDITGIQANEIRQAAKTAGFLAGVLQFIAAHEPTLIAFANNAQCKPENIIQAIRHLPGGEHALSSI